MYAEKQLTAHAWIAKNYAIHISKAHFTLWIYDLNKVKAELTIAAKSKPLALSVMEQQRS